MQFQTKAYGAVYMVATRFSGALLRVQGQFDGATADMWLHLFDAAQLPANGVTPLKSYPLPQTSPFHWGFDPGTLLFSQGLVVAVSSTPIALTIATGLNVANFFVDFDSAQHAPGTSIVGNLTTARETLDVVTTDSTVYYVDAWVTGTPAEDPLYVMLFDGINIAAASNAVPVAMYVYHASGKNTKYRFDFGSNGKRFLKCCVGLSSDGTKYVATGSNNLLAQAVYL